MALFRALRLVAILSFLSLVSASPSVLKKRATCTVSSAGTAGTDDVPAIENAIKSCGNGGIVVLSAGKTYMIRSTLDFTGCSGCEVQIEGTLKLSDDTNFWNGVRAAILLTNLNGATVHSKTGSGVVDGNGVPFWQKFASDSSFKRPTLMYISGGSNIVVENLYFKNAPNVFHSVTDGATNVIYRGLKLNATPKDGAVPKNTDGFDVGKSTYVTISNTNVVNQDDCVAFKPGCNYVTVTDITCTGSHGLSVGSLAKGSNDIVTNVIVNGATMIDSTKATGIKLYDGASGHGVATVRNVTFQDVTVQNCEYAAQIQSCYSSSGTCVASKHTIDQVYWKNIRGTTATKFDPTVANMNCPSSGTCNIFFQDFTVKAPSGKANVLCSAVDSNLGVSCSGSASG
ncbi:extracellular exo-polygalacturonase [Moniliophthora roreri MCA 2997]|uniref:Extracellular exo-polygalacturonase n=1 Tax=Moniliophthora roreri (strain MCA 2997) TaxID=1381753 RepID=V2YM41_MONRO|nr:extracellular exo-polygalacturonase [Moniliophthora roreri MCA 2997]